MIRQDRPQKADRPWALWRPYVRLSLMLAAIAWLEIVAVAVLVDWHAWIVVLGWPIAYGFGFGWVYLWAWFDRTCPPSAPWFPFRSAYPQFLLDTMDRAQPVFLNALLVAFPAAAIGVVTVGLLTRGFGTG